ncbi:hypothetical protein [Infirmifilum sp. NZ]|uniref:hypothetical protein n=1 Tax=Infirmifilum sp. NZ TaxID=2926850 RepID=UPI0027A75490|nr:hypothetical protein [Infirmifilum sp. NZ]UNQ73051.1 hypothetical protein MOV14_08050 [Infirmifilum sp. NZ]
MCVVSRSLVCASSKTYVFTIKAECADKVVDLLEREGKVTARFGPLVKGVYKDAIVTVVKPDKVQVILQFSKLTVDEVEQVLRSLA